MRALDVDRGRIVRPLIAALIGVLIGTILVGPVPAVLSRMTNSRTVGGNTMTTAASFDVTPPTIAGSVVAKTTSGYLAGFIKPSGSFYVYANVTDTGASASGVATVTADVSSIKAGATAVALVAGSYSAQGVSYSYRSASRVADAKPAGTYSYSIRAVDNAGNVATASFTVVIDKTAPAGTDIQTTNGGTAGRPDTGDTIVLTYTEQIDPGTILAGWDGTSTDVVVRFTDTSSADSVVIRNAANSATLPLGTVALMVNVVTTNTTFTATMVESGATITVTLGTMTRGAVVTNTVPTSMNWTPSATAKDAAGNACSATLTTESGPADVHF